MSKTIDILSQLCFNDCWLKAVKIIIPMNHLNVQKKIVLQLATVVLAFLPVVAYGASYTVTTENDELDGSPICETGSSIDCSLREAIVQANANSGSDTIIIPAGEYTLTLGSSGEDSAAEGDLDITDLSGTLTIEGAGEEETIIDGNANDRIFDVIENADFTISDVTIQNGNTENGGGGLRAASRTVITMSRVTFADNVETNASSFSGGGGGALIRNSLAIIDSATFTNNSTSANGGGLMYSNHTNGDMGERYLSLSNSQFTSNEATTTGGGLGITNTGVSDDSTITDSTFTENTAEDGAGVFVDGNLTYNTDFSGITVENNTASRRGGGLVLELRTRLLDSSVVSNESDNGGGIYVYVGQDTNVIDNTIIAYNTSSGRAGGLHVAASTLSAISSRELDIVNTTIANNTASTEGGAMFLNSSQVDVIFRSSLIAGNEANTGGVTSSAGGGINNRSINSATIYNSIISENTDTGSASNCILTDPLVSGGYNIEDGTDCGFEEATDMQSTDPLLVEAGLEDNGGDFQTIGLQASSPAVDAIPYASCLDEDEEGMTQDQRGYTRSDAENCDIGPYELDQTAPTITISGSASATVECTATYTDAGATSSDDFMSSPSVSTTNPVDSSIPGTYTVIYSSTDYDNNIGTGTRSVTVSDTIDPTISLTGEASITLTAGDTYNEEGATATDTCDSSVSVTTSGSVDTDTAGTYTLTYTATDDSENSASVTRTVTVEAAATVSDVTPLTNSRVRVTYSDGTTRTIRAFAKGAKKPRVKLTNDGQRVVVLKRNGKNVRVFDAFTGERLKGKKVRNAAQARAYLKLVQKNGKEYVVVVTKKGTTIRTTLMRLTAADKLLNTNTKRLTYRKSNFRVQIRNTRIFIKKRSGTVKRVYKITSRHRLKKVR